MTKLKSVTTKLPQEVHKMWLDFCKKKNKTSYEFLQELIASELGIKLKKEWIIDPIDKGEDD